jgi:hypothetical protein
MAAPLNAAKAAQAARQDAHVVQTIDFNTLPQQLEAQVAGAVTGLFAGRRLRAADDGQQV